MPPFITCFEVVYTSEEFIDKRHTEEDNDIKSSVRMTAGERELVVSKFGGVQAAWDKVVKEASEDKGWIPELPRRLIPAYLAIRDIAIDAEQNIVNSGKLREVVMNACNCTRRTATNHLHELKDRRLIMTLGLWGDEMVHVVVCNADMLAKVKKHEEEE